MNEPIALPPPEDSNPMADRWNKPKMALFLRELAASHSVAAAARAVGMSRQSAYNLRSRLKGEPFDIAWEAAFQHAYDALHQAALERAMFGVEVPVFSGGEQIGTRRHFDERLTCFLLSARNHQGAQQLSRYRAAADFWSERWDEMLDRVENGHARWQREVESEGRTAEDVVAAQDDRDREDSCRSTRYTAPDPLPRGRQDG
jgi:hypothetical protein